MSPEMAINILCSSGNLSAESLNVLHACRTGHPLNNPQQWRNAAFIVGGRRPWFGDEHNALRIISQQAELEAQANP